MTPLKLRVSLGGVLRQAAECIEGLAGEVCEHEGFRFDPRQDGDADSPDCFEEYQPLSNAFMLREVYRCVNETADGKHSIQEFAEFFGLRRETEAWVDAIGSI